ncbi:hypothetical protein QZH41_000206 [Actinostola sp. cb2023]|nr:hypothetical protein QZH41_000206 [Actinostola sp. cb2023]
MTIVETSQPAAAKAFGIVSAPTPIIRYHDWMQSPELLEQTASERLTLNQEYDMQQSWCEDENSTPSLAKPSTISAILDCVTSTCQMDGKAEVSLEANPSSSETLLLRSFKAAGVNRLSLGVQSLCSKDLALLGRDHTFEESLRSLEEAKTLFLGKVSIDLLFGRPQQTVSAWEKELQKVLAQEGFQRYEVSSFAKPGSESQHNLSYWTGVPYIGIGPGAHSRYAYTCISM